MTYRRIAIVNRRDTRSEKNSHPISSFDRIVAGSSLIANILFGIATTTLTILALNLNKDFNEWQRQSADQQDVYNQKQACIQISFQALNQIRRNQQQLIDAAISAISEIDPKCRKVGISVSRFTSAMIIKNSEKFSESTVDSAKKNIEKLPNAPEVILNRSNADSIFSTITNKDAIDSERLRKTKSAISENISAQNYSDVDQIISETSKQLERNPRIDAGVGVFLNDPFGPFKVDTSRALEKEQVGK